MARLLTKRGICPWPRSKTANAVVDLLSGTRPLDPAVLFFQNRSITGRLMILRSRRDLSTVKLPKRIYDKPSAHFAHARGQFRGSFVRSDFQFTLQEKIALVSD